MQDKAKNAGKVAIVLEGGSFRGEFTAGVLDVLMENGVEVAACYGTSAGALNGLNYKSRQIGRVNRVNLAFCNDPRYMGAQSLVTTGSMVGYDFILNDVQDRLDPFDNEAFFANPMEMYACATDIVFGTAAYLPVRDATLDIDAVRASTSLPLVTKPVEIGGHLYLDGGTADSVPVEHVLENAGFDRAIVVLTQDLFRFLNIRCRRRRPFQWTVRRLLHRNTGNQANHRDHHQVISRHHQILRAFHQRGGKRRGQTGNQYRDVKGCRQRTVTNMRREHRRQR